MVPSQFEQVEQFCMNLTHFPTQMTIQNKAKIKGMGKILNICQIL